MATVITGVESIKFVQMLSGDEALDLMIDKQIGSCAVIPGHRVNKWRV